MKYLLLLFFLVGCSCVNEMPDEYYEMTQRVRNLEEKMATITFDLGPFGVMCKDVAHMTCSQEVEIQAKWVKWTGKDGNVYDPICMLDRVAYTKGQLITFIQHANPKECL